MRNKFQLLFILLMIIFFSFPSICFSELKTVEGEYCDVYVGDMKNKKKLGELRKSVSYNAIKNCLNSNMLHEDLEGYELGDECIINIKNFLEKIIVISHTEKGRKICEKVKIIFDPAVIVQFVNHSGKCPRWVPFMEGWVQDIRNLLKSKSENINIGLIIETKIPGLGEYKREILENDEERQFHEMIGHNKVIDRRHLSKILEEQKLSLSGITDSETVKLSKLLNLDIIVLRTIYEKSKMTKVLKVDTGEVLLFRTYSAEKGH